MDKTLLKKHIKKYFKNNPHEKYLNIVVNKNNHKIKIKQSGGDFGLDNLEHKLELSETYKVNIIMKPGWFGEKINISDKLILEQKKNLDNQILTFNGKLKKKFKEYKNTYNVSPEIVINYKNNKLEIDDNNKINVDSLYIHSIDIKKKTNKNKNNKNKQEYEYFINLVYNLTENYENYITTRKLEIYV
jgi:hypothetical protein